MITKQPVNFIFRGDGFELDLANYQYDERFKKARHTLNARKFTSKETNLTYRILTHWASLGMLPQGAQVSEGWHKFTLLELIWLRVALRFRDFGVPLELLGKIKDQVMDWDRKHQEYPKFEYYVAKAWFSDGDPHVLFLHNGFAEVAMMNELNLSKTLNAIPRNSDMILISLKSVLEEVGITPVPANNPHTLSKEETDLLGAIRTKPNKEIKISLDDERHITGIEEIKEQVNPEAIHEVYKEMKDNGAYGDVQTKYVNGKPVRLKVSQKKKYKR